MEILNYKIKAEKKLFDKNTLNRIATAFTAVICCNLLSAQTGEKDSWTTISDFTPKSPEAQAFQKYGDYNVNFAKGLANISVPLHTLEAGDYKLPISLNYNPSGIKVNQEATWVGLGWTLQAGAQITLDARDSPDETVDENMPDLDAVSNLLNQTPPWDYCNYEISLLRNNSWIKDVYHFSSPTAQGKFIIGDVQDPNKILIYPPDAFKVETSENKHNRQFKITDPQGNVYLFNNTRETSRSVGVEHDTNYYTTAWYVDQIKTPSNNTIDFAYTNDGWHSNTNTNDQIIVSKTYSDCSPGAPQTEIMTGSIKRNSINSTKTFKLSSITYKDFRILFIAQSGRLDLASPSLLDQARFPTENVVPAYLKFIKIQNKVNDAFADSKGYELTYSYFDPGGTELEYVRKRLKLLAVNDLIDDNIATKFTYSDINPPSKNSKEMDAWGYYNGASNNLTLVPRQHIWLNNGKVTLGSANRDVNTNAAQAGILTEIQYPTKGKTKFIYESNSYFGVDELNRNREVIENSHIVQGKGSPLSTLEEDCDSCFVYNEIKYDLIDASARLAFKINYTGNLTINKYQYARVRVYKNGSSAPIFDSSKVRSSMAFDESVNLSGSGSVYIEAFGQEMSVRDLQLIYIKLDDIPKNVSGPGLRIAAIENYADDLTLASKKKYSYAIPDQGSKSSGRLVFDAVRKFDPETFRTYEKIRCGSQFGTFWKIDYNTIYSGQSPYFLMNEVYYTDVKEENIDYTNVLKNGYTAYNYDFTPSYNSQDGSINIEFDWLRGNLLSKKVYNSNNKILQEEQNAYFEDTSKTTTISGIKIFTREKFITCPNVNGPPPNIVPFQNMGYRYVIPWHYLKSKTVTETFYDASNNVKSTAVSSTSFNYNNPMHMQLSSQKTTSSKGETLESRYFYPGDSELDAEPLMSNLVAANRLIPIKTQNFVKSNKISESKKIFKDWGNQLIQPEIIQSSKGNAPLENRIRIVELDNTNGNMLQQKQENGIDITYIWGYNGIYPIAKIENMSYQQVKTALGMNDEAIRSLTEVPSGFRALLPSNSFATTYTYKLGIGVSSINDPKGITTKFEYDRLGRLVLTRDQDNKIISENKYNYRY